MNETNIESSPDSFTALRIISAVVALPLTAVALLVVRNQLHAGFDLIGAIFGSGAATFAIICWWFTLRGQIPESRARMRFALLGGCILGGIGFAADFVGPVIFTPRSNQGPLLGIFITGPLGFVLGAAAGWVYAHFRIPRQGSE